MCSAASDKRAWVCTGLLWSRLLHLWMRSLLIERELHRPVGEATQINTAHHKPEACNGGKTTVRTYCGMKVLFLTPFQDKYS